MATNDIGDGWVQMNSADRDSPKCSDDREKAAYDDAIDDWRESVWAAYSDSHGAVVELLRRHGIP
jgi:hypothetical protein